MADEQDTKWLTGLDDQIRALRHSSTYVASCYRLAPDEITALKQSLVLFAEANERLAKRLCIAEAMRPRIIDADGRKIRWDAPSELVPTESV